MCFISLLTRHRLGILPAGMINYVPPLGAVDCGDQE